MSSRPDFVFRIANRMNLSLTPILAVILLTVWMAATNAALAQNNIRLSAPDTTSDSLSVPVQRTNVRSTTTRHAVPARGYASASNEPAGSTGAAGTRQNPTNLTRSPYGYSAQNPQQNASLQGRSQQTNLQQTNQQRTAAPQAVVPPSNDRDPFRIDPAVRPVNAEEALPPATPEPTAAVPETPAAVPTTPAAVPATPVAVPTTPAAVPTTPAAVPTTPAAAPEPPALPSVPELAPPATPNLAAPTEPNLELPTVPDLTPPAPEPAAAAPADPAPASAMDPAELPAGSGVLAPLEPVQNNNPAAPTTVPAPGPGLTPPVNPGFIPGSGAVSPVSQPGPGKNPSGSVGPRNAVDANYSLGTGEPGAKILTGLQAPQLTVEKIPPQELLVGQSAVWKTVIRNTGASLASNVVVRDLVPRGTQLIETVPPANKGVNGDLVWTIGELAPGKEIVVSMELIPLDEGRVGSVAQVSFQTSASAEGVVAKPQLALQTQGVREVAIGNSTELTIFLSNPGTGAAKNVVLTENVPPQLQHEANDSILTYNVGDLQPDETRTIKLNMVAIRPGKFANTLSATADPSLKAESRFEMEVVAPALQMNVAGPTRRFLEREGTHRITISNPGTAPAKNVSLKVQLPTGLQFVSANNAGSYDKQTRTVRWLLEELPAADTGEVELTTIPTQIGQQLIRYQANADKGVQTMGQKECLVEGMAALLTQLSDTSDPVLVGEKSSYLISVINQGSKASGNVRVTAQIPAGMEFLAAEGPTNYRVDPSGLVVFDPIPQLAPKADLNFKVLVRGVKPGDQRLKLSVVSDELTAPVTKEESTQVYQDQ